MAMKINQALKQTQNLTMTPQLQQAIKLLTLTHLEMTDVIAKEMVENPMLEESGGERTTEEVANDYKETTKEDFSGPEIVEGSKEEFDWEKYIETYNDGPSAPRSASDFSKNDEQPDYENMVSQEMSLPDHLEWQVRMCDYSDEELRLALGIIHNINDDGFLETGLSEIINANNISIDYDEAEGVLFEIQNFDPIGCGTKNTKEALLIQAKAVPGRSPLTEKIIEDHLQDLYQNNYDKIAKETGSSIDNIKASEMIIMTFHPRPGRLISPEQTHYVVPDIFVKEVSGELIVTVNNEGVPRLRISKLYQSLLKSEKKEGKKGDTETKDFIQDKLRSALWLIKSIENRQRTIEKVAKAIVAYQPDFFRKGPEFLKPMILKDIAEEVEMHESTVSRVTTNKFAHTPLGTFELKYFFNNAVGGKDGGMDVASESLKLKIKALIEKEDPRKPLSDQKIVTFLEEQGINIARRTVAKYRESLGILSSSKRRKK